MAKCFSNHSERNDDIEILKELGIGSNCNSLRKSRDENKPHELLGIPISADGCNNKIESFDESWMILAEIKDTIFEIGNT